jgi:Homocysteine/selenocysteine methylase (S-methylmethionine-dependent)
MTFLARLRDPRPILLDGATGSELDRRGADTSLPLWSARALLESQDILAAIHADYARVGAEVITANTFRTHQRSLAKGGLGERAAELTRTAVAIARRAAPSAFVAGSLAPLEDCYSPELVPPPAECEREHTAMAGHLAEAGADLILIETMNTIREAEAAARAALATGLPTLVSFVCRSDGRLFSGERVTDAARALAALGVHGLLINCTPAPTIQQPFAELRAAVGALPSGLYANIGHTDEIKGWTNTLDVTPAEYARLAAAWLAAGARLVGGCCGTTPEHIAAIKTILN